MKLAEAIRLGAMSLPQAKGGMYSKGAACAIGAALYAVGRLIERAGDEGNYDAAYQQWPILTRDFINPATGEDEELLWIIASLNDSYGWSRERIADWVETIDRRAEADSARTEQKTASPAVSFAQTGL